MSVSLTKGASVNLSKAAAGLALVTLGVGWDAAKPKGFFGGLMSAGSGNIDLDASAAVFDASGALLDTVWFGHLTSNDRAINHSGDNLTGDGDGDDEAITVDLGRLDPRASAIVLTVSSFRGQTFDKIANAFGRVVDAKTGTELARFDISDAGPHTGLILGVLHRQGGEWHFKALGTRTGGRRIHDIAHEAGAAVRAL